MTRILLVAAGALLCGPAAAHAFLQRASPPVGGTVATAPATVAIDFTQGVEPGFSTIAVTDASGTRVDTGAAHLAPGGDTRLVTDLKPLAPGSYTVEWHVTSVDTHKTEGRFSFAVKP